MIVKLPVLIVSVLLYTVTAAPLQKTWKKMKNTDYEYMISRQKILDEEANQRLGHDIVLNKSEEIVNTTLMAWKVKELDIYEPFILTGNFLEVRKEIEQSPVYKLIKRMPKGGVLHIHDLGIVNHEWLVKNVTYMKHCYIGVNKTLSQIRFRFSQQIPQIHGFEWFTVEDRRMEYHAGVEAFDEWLKTFMVMHSPVSTIYKDENKIWADFLEIFNVVGGLINYEPVLRMYHRKSMEQALEDNVQYMEIRAHMRDIYRLDGSSVAIDQVLQIYENVTKQFVTDNPQFIGAKIIHEDIRFQPKTEILESIKEGVKLKEKFPDTYLGYDLVAQEDLGHPLTFYLDELLWPQQNGFSLPFYFHAGETNWQDSHIDENLIDAVLLKSRRLGHAFSIVKHPQVMQIVKQNKTAIEVNPISNQVLGLVSDLRNHPMTALIAQDYPIVISSDDPAMWEADILSHDFYVAFMALCGKKSDLRLLKKLAYNSILYSGLTEPEKTDAFTKWSHAWDNFIKTETALI